MADEVNPQRRGRRIAMSATERDGFLAAERTCRVATAGPDGPHATPLWFVWDGACLWLYSLVRSRRWADLQHDPRIGVVVDAGVEYLELRGVEITGRAEVVGDVPRTDAPEPALAGIERAFAAKYFAGAEQMFHDARHAWLRVTPTKIVSWDFRKLAG
ncbi:MAG TPA: pyridoxamine 5'-phosphate oxidase family protein [Jatrophihabitans sp.]|nr:pyridoxamine 5'-phosphate oxidase family protein [Jatrophihabitans sp.]